MSRRAKTTIDTHCQLVNATLFLKSFQIIVDIQRAVASNVDLKTLDNMLGLDVHLRYMMKGSLSFGWTVRRFALRNAIKTALACSSRRIGRGIDSTRGTFSPICTLSSSLLAFTFTRHTSST
jgi:hypothetical protein